MTQALTCPKCGSEMRTYERNEVVVDHCNGCGGLFLDRGELERLVEAESSFYTRTEPSPIQAPPPHMERREDGFKKPKKKKGARSFLEDFLEF